ncbi:MAG: hypothetical protein JXA67_15465 [Micromonosporaceae bacterium]|nr:hypothetical protein [Micromonosporaceae bacterium]
MTIHLVTVGTTARTYVADPRGERDPIPTLLNGNGDLRDHQFLRVDEYQPQQAADLLRRLADGGPDAVALARRAVDAAGVAMWPTFATAESTTLATVTGHATVGGDDLVILIATDTVPGLLSAFWNAALLLRGDFGRLDYLDDPPITWDDRDEQRLKVRGRLLVARIRGLDLSRAEDPGEAMRRLGHLGRLVLESTNADERIVVHPSGGYKATIPFIIGIAEGMRSVRVAQDGKPPQVEASVVHEDSKPPRKIDMPLRRFKTASVTAELRVFGTSRRSTLKPSGDALEGYAYNREGNHWTLTPFGEGFLALIGPDEVAQ